MKATSPVLVFSDLDGTLLDHASYSWAAATDALTHLRGLGAGVVLATSKTAAEVAPLREAIGFADWPAIVENGGGLLWPEDPPDQTGPVYQRLRARLHSLPAGFVGFGDMSVSEICDRTGLPEEEAKRAKSRRFSEPGIWTGPDGTLDAFVAAAKAAGLAVQRGGRFLSLSFGGTKADRMDDVIARYAPRCTIALGDAPNDIQMLDRADYGVIVANPAAAPLPRLPGEASGRIRRTARPGPMGWSDATFDILDEISMTRETTPHG